MESLSRWNVELRPFGKTGILVSKLGYGASPLGGEFGPIDEAEGHRSVHRAIELGINLFDVAPYYGRTKAESVLGDALVGRRDQVVLCSKVGRYDKADFDFSPDRVIAGLDESLTRLKTDRLDLVIMHDVEFRPLGPIIEETVPALLRAKAAGKVRAVGVSGLPLAALLKVVEATDLDFVLSYCHYTLNDRTLADRLATVAQAKGMGVINAAPLAMGLLTQFDPPPWHPGPDALKSACRKAAEVCAERGVDLADLALAFSVAAPFVHSTVVGMPTVKQVERNVAAIAGPIDAELLAEVEAILAPVSGLTWASGLPENQG